MQESELGALRDIFLDEADDLLSLMSDRLGRISNAETEDEEASLDEVAAAGHTLRGSAALAQLPGLSRAGAVFERAAELVGEHAQRNADTARSLVREALAALGPARRMVEAARAGAVGTQESLVRELLETFSPAYHDELAPGRVDDEEPQETPAQLFGPDIGNGNGAGSEPGDLDASSAGVFWENPAGDLRSFDAGESSAGSSPKEGFALTTDTSPEDDAGGSDFETSFDADLAASLAETFQSELKELLTDVPDLLGGLVDPAEQMNLCADLARIFHTVKGSAATVGREHCRDLGYALQQAFERPMEDPSLLPLRPEFADEIAAPLQEVFLAAGLEPPLAALELVRGIAGASLRDDDDGGDAEASPLASIASDESSVPDAASEPPVEPEIMEAFTLDADTALDACEGAILGLERNPTDRGPLRTLFRQFHTLKGAAAAVGLSRIAEQLHAGETLLEESIDRGPPIEGERFVELLLEILDSMAGMIAEARGIAHEHRILADVETRIAEVVAESAGSATAPHPETGPLAADSIGATSPSASRAALASSHEPSSIASPSAAAPARTEASTTLLSPPSTATGDADTAIVRVHASRLDLLMSRVSELVVSRTRMEDAMSAIRDLRDKLHLGRLRLNETTESFRGFEFNSTAPSGSDGASTGSHLPEDFSDLEFDKYDDFNVLTRTLVELTADAGEMLEQLNVLLDAVGEEGRQVSKVTSSLQRTVSAMRLLSLDALFRKLQRAVRDAARQMRRPVEVVCVGGDVQLDRGLIESLYGPLLHVVRNAVSHGIELPETRTTAGKRPEGRVTIEAVQRQGSVEIAVRDDGRGLDFPAIRAKAERLGMLPPGVPADREQLARMIFRPGFSTKERVDDLSGRGIGMDVVASEVEQLRGTVSVESRDGQGSTFRITLPLTAMIEQVLVLRVGDQSLALSQGPIETVIYIDSEHIERTEQGLRVRVGDAVLPALSLATLAGKKMGHPTTALVLRSADEGGQRVALLVDRIEAQREAVVRPLGRLFSGHPFITSATFAGDGQVVFVLDAARLPGLATRALPAPSIEVVDEVEEVEEQAAKPAPLEAMVLWADDSISVRKLAGLFLSAEGWTGETAVDGIDALDKLRRGRFRIVVTDLEMPRMHGYELLQEIRSDPQLQDLPVVVCSSRSSEKHRQRAREAGANGYLTKPFTQETLAAVLREYLGGAVPG